MLHQVRGIVFKTVKYAESSVICTVYTDKFGIQSYLINGVRGTKSKNKQSLVQPVSLLQMVVYHRENKQLQRVREFNFDYIYTSLPFAITKSSIALFLIEILYKTIREHESNEALFDFIHNSFVALDKMTGQMGAFHLHFLVHLSRYLGFMPADNYAPSNPVFDLREGTYCASDPGHGDIIQYPESKWLFRLSGIEAYAADESTIPKPSRKKLLRQLITYYALHIESFGRVRSVDILEQVLASG